MGARPFDLGDCQPYNLSMQNLPLCLAFRTLGQWFVLPFWSLMTAFDVAWRPPGKPAAIAAICRALESQPVPVVPEVRRLISMEKNQS